VKPFIAFTPAATASFENAVVTAFVVFSFAFAGSIRRSEQKNGFFNADGTLGIRPLKGARNMRLTRHSIRALGFDKRLTTLVRLARAGFIEVSHPSPGIRLLNVDSWFEHLRRTQEDPDFWDEDGENWRNYMMRNGLRVK